MVTPLTDRDTLDVAGLERLVERLVSGGVAGIFALGTTGEAPSLGYRLRRELIEHSRITPPIAEPRRSSLRHRSISRRGNRSCASISSNSFRNCRCR
jgi:hypothetical protein